MTRRTPEGIEQTLQGPRRDEEDKDEAAIEHGVQNPSSHIFSEEEDGEDAAQDGHVLLIGTYRNSS